MAVRRMAIAGALAMATTVAMTGQAFAHHSAAMFDRTKTLTIDATVKAFRWSNPHATIEIVAPGGDGVERAWNVECSTPNILARKGWTAKSFKPGDKISLTMNPMKDGSAAGLLMTVTQADGHQLADHNY